MPAIATLFVANQKRRIKFPISFRHLLRGSAPSEGAYRMSSASDSAVATLISRALRILRPYAGLFCVTALVILLTMLTNSLLLEIRPPYPVLNVRMIVMALGLAAIATVGVRIWQQKQLDIRNRLEHTLAEAERRLSTLSTSVDAVASLKSLVDNAPLAMFALRTEARNRTLLNMSVDWYWEQDEQLRFTSVGVCIYPRDGLDADTLLEHADLALYQAKDKGRNTYRFFNPDMNARAQTRLRTENALRRAVKHAWIERKSTAPS